MLCGNSLLRSTSRTIAHRGRLVLKGGSFRPFAPRNPVFILQHQRESATAIKNNVDYRKLHKHSIEDPSAFWDEAAADISWFKPYDETLRTMDAYERFAHHDPAVKIPEGITLANWFHGGKLNTCYNCVDKHVDESRGDDIAIIFDSPVTNTIQSLSYHELHCEVIKFARVLRRHGIESGDTVVIYMPNIPHTAIAMLACARIGAVHSVVFGGFAPNELAVRIKDSKPAILVAASCGIEGQSKVIDYKPMVDQAIEIASSEHIVTKCIILQRELSDPPASLPPLPKPSLIPGRDYDWATESETGGNTVRMSKFGSDTLFARTPEDVTVDASELDLEEDGFVIDASDACVPLDSEHPLYVLYTSGTTGKPKGVVRDTGGHAVALKWAMKNIMGAKPGDVYWAASDVGWVVGHSFSVYGPLLLGCTTLLYEGKPVGTPDAANFWRTIERHRVNTLFTAPTAIRAIKREDEDGELAAKFKVSDSLRALFLAGERADPDTLKWVESTLDHKVPIRDNWWQTETGWPICSNLLGLEGALPIKYGSTFRPCPGYDVCVLSSDDSHELLPPNTMGLLAIKLPMPPGVMLGLFNSPLRFLESYFYQIPGYYSTGDAGMVDEEGYVYVMSRTDDVINVAGHRLSSGAIEEVLVDHHDVAEAAVVGVRDTLKGQLPLGLLVLNSHCTRSGEAVVREVVQAVRDRIGPVAAFKKAVVVARLPKTRSGKILRATMRAIANGDEYTVPATCEDVAVIREVEAIILSHYR